MKNERKNFLAVDIGASSGRVFIGRLRGDDLEIQRAHRFVHPIIERNTVKCWNWDLINYEISKGLATACDMTGDEKIESVCCDSWSQDFGLLDEDGVLFYEPVSYRDDRTEGLPYSFSDVIAPLELLKRNGSYVSPITTLCQLYSMTQNEPEMIRRAGTLLFIADLLNYRLCGAKVTDPTFASASQMYNIKSGEWDKELLGKLGIPESMLPPISGNPSITGTVNYSGCPPKLRGIPVISGSGHDTSLAASTVFPLEKGSLFMSLGTWAMLGCCNGNTVEPEILKDTSVSLMKLAWGEWAYFDKGGTGMWLLEECIRRWNREGNNTDYSILSAASENSGVNSIIDVNDSRFFAPPDMAAEIYDACIESGQQPPEKPGDYARVIFKSLVHGFGKSVKNLSEITGMNFRNINISGGATRNRFLCSQTAKTLGIPVITGPAEATITGNILLQARVLDIIANENDAAAVIERSFPATVYDA